MLGGGEEADLTFDATDDNEAAAVVPGESLTMRLWLPNVHVGTVIGKGGAKIQSIRELSACKVSISENVPGAAERLMSVTGIPQCINSATELMLDALEEAQKSDPAADATVEMQHSLKLVMSNNQAGGIIGKGGASIKAMREESGAAIKVEAPGSGGPQERVVVLSGTKASVVKANLLVMLKLAEMPEEGLPPGQPQSYKHQKTAGMPMGMPRGAGAYPPMPQQLGWGQPPPLGAQAAPGFPQSPYAPPQAYAQPSYGQAYGQANATAAQTPQGFAAADGGFSAQAYGQAQQAYLQYAQQGYAGFDATALSQSWANTPAATAAGAYGQQAPAVPNTAVAGPGGAQEQLVPIQLIGRLIGKGGSGIKEMRELSRANIKINSDCEPGTESRKVVVSGTPEQCQLALSLIQQKLAQGP